MYNDHDIEAIIEPLLSIQRDINRFVISKIAERVKAIGDMSAADLHRLEQLYRSSQDVEEIKKEIARLTGKSKKEIEQIIRKCAQENYADVRPFYEQTDSYIPLEQNAAVQAEIEAVSRRTVQTYSNIANTSAYFLRDPLNRNILIPTDPSNIYTKIIDEAILFARRGVVDYHSAIRTSMREVIDSGLCVRKNNVNKVEYASGNLRRLDTAVRMNILEGIKQINQGVQDITGEQFGADGKEISVHFAPAPDHEQCQGHMFTLENYDRLNQGETVEDVNGVKIEGFTRKIGTLNCKHFAYSVIIGISEPIYSPEDLEKFIVRNHEGFEYGGKHYTMYQAEQKQRQLETNIRRAKDGINAARAAGDQALIGRYTEKYYKYHREYTRFSKAAGLSEKKDRITVSGFKRPMSEKTLDAMNEKRQRVFTNGGNSGIMNRDILQSRIDSGEISLQVNPEKQRRHIIGSPQYIEGRSYLTVSESEAQEIINRYHGTGKIRITKSGQIRETIATNHEIGICVPQLEGQVFITYSGTIHYSKTGTHLVPAKESKGELSK